MAKIHSQIETARKEGMSDDEIWTYLSSKNNQTKNALKEMSEADVKTYLGLSVGGVQPQTLPQQPTPASPQPSFLDKMIGESKGVPKEVYNNAQERQKAPPAGFGEPISTLGESIPGELDRTPYKDQAYTMPYPVRNAVLEKDTLAGDIWSNFMRSIIKPRQQMEKLTGAVGKIFGAPGRVIEYGLSKGATSGRESTFEGWLKELGYSEKSAKMLGPLWKTLTSVGVWRAAGKGFDTLDGEAKKQAFFKEYLEKAQEIRDTFGSGDLNKMADFARKYPEAEGHVVSFVQEKFPQDARFFMEKLGIIDVAPTDVGGKPTVEPPTKSSLLSQTGTGAGATFDPSKIFNLASSQIPPEIVPEMPAAPMPFGAASPQNISKDITVLSGAQGGGGQIPPASPPPERAKYPKPQKIPKTKDPNPTVPFIDQEYERLKDGWIGEEDWQAVKASVKTSELQDKIKISTGESKFGNLSKDTDKAIQVYIDLLAAPIKGDETRYYNKLTPEQKRIVSLAKNLTPEQKEIANEIIANTDEIGQKALDSGVIRNKKEVYTARYWDLEPENKFFEKFRKFGTSTGHAKQREFNSIIEGWATKKGSSGEGYKLKVEGATNSFNIVKNEIDKVIGDRQFIGELSKLKTIDGDPLISTKQLPGYERVEHPNFKKWGWVGSVETKAIVENIEKIIDKTTQTKTVSQAVGKEDLGPIKTMKGIVNDALRARGFSEGESSNIMSRLEGAKPGDKETIIKEITNKIIQKEQKIKGIEISPLRAKNMFINQKGDILQRQEVYAPKHIAKNLNNMMGASKIKGIPFIDWATKWNAITKNWILQSTFFHHQAGARSYYFGSSPLKIEKNFMKSIENFTPGKAYKLGLDRLKTLSPEIELLIRNRLTVGKVQDWEEDIIRKEDTFVGKILDKYNASKKIKDKINKLREDQADFLFKRFMPGLKINAALIELRRILEETPSIDPNKAARIATDLMNDDFGGLHLKGMGRNPTTQHIFRLFALAPDWTESNIRTMVKAFKGGEEGKAYRNFWGRVIGKTAMSTVAMNALLHGDKTADVYKRAWKEGNLKWLDVDVTPIYKAVGGKTKKRKYFSIMGHFKDPVKFVAFPIRSTHNKGSIIYRSIYNAISGEDWAGRKYTGLEELFKTGKTTKFDPFNKMRASSYSRVPSYLLEQAKNTQPIQVQNLINWYQGEIDGFDAVLNSLGVNIRTTYK